MPRRARPRRRPGESYEERSERRQEAREGMCHRNNVTSCRQPARPAPRSPHSPRQREFLRRRNLPGEALGTLLGQEPKERTVLEPGPSILLQVTQLRAQPAPGITAQSSAQSSACSSHPWSISIQPKCRLYRQKGHFSQNAEPAVGTHSPPCSSRLPSPRPHGDFSAISPSTTPPFCCQAAVLHLHK